MPIGTIALYEQQSGWNRLGHIQEKEEKDFLRFAVTYMINKTSNIPWNFGGRDEQYVYKVDSLDYGADIPLPEAPVMDGYTFKGWYLPYPYESMPAFDIVIWANYHPTSGVSDVLSNSDQASGVWYTLDGRRLTAAPSRKGVYIHDGRKMVVK